MCAQDFNVVIKESVVKSVLRSLFGLYLLFILLFFSGCNDEYKFLYESSQISSIEIVEVTDNIIDGQVEQIVICIIDDTEEFMEGFKKIKCRSYFDDPTRVETGETAIKIIYDNGEYELISSGGQSRYTHEKQYQMYKGFYGFDDEEFEVFLQKYIGNEE